MANGGGREKERGRDKKRWKSIRGGGVCIFFDSPGSFRVESSPGHGEPPIHRSEPGCFSCCRRYRCCCCCCWYRWCYWCCCCCRCCYCRRSSFSFALSLRAAWYLAGWQVKPGTWNIHRTLGWTRRDRTSICQPASSLLCSRGSYTFPCARVCVYAFGYEVRVYSRLFATHTYTHSASSRSGYIGNYMERWDRFSDECRFHIREHAWRPWVAICISFLRIVCLVVVWETTIVVSKIFLILLMKINW